MLEKYLNQIEILEKLVNEHQSSLSCNKVLDCIEYLKHQIRVMENETSEWSEYFGRLP